MSSLVIGNILRYGLELFGRYYGLYDFVVTNNADPEGRGRVQGYCPKIGQDACPYDRNDERREAWVRPNFPGAGAVRSGSVASGGAIQSGHGWFWPAEDGDIVKVSFVDGNPDRPDFYLGGWYARDEEGGIETPEEFRHARGTNPKKRGVKTPGGHLLVFDDTTGARLIKFKHADGSLLSWEEGGIGTMRTNKGDEFVLDGKNGVARLKDQHGNKITTDKAGISLADCFANTVETRREGVSVDTKTALTLKGKSLKALTDTVELTRDANRSAVLGEELAQALKAHALAPHGPVGAPAPPILETYLSRKVKLS